MLIISHRGNLNGSNPLTENKPEYIIKAIELGFHVEIDIHVINNNIYLGHDYPKYLIDIKFLKQYKKFLWIHCKNFEALNYFVGSDFNYFWHQEDDYTLTSKGQIWTYPNKNISKNSIIVDLLGETNNLFVYGICTDYPKKY